VELRQKKHGRGDHPDIDGGAVWDHVALDPRSKLVVALAVGPRTEEQTRHLVQEAQARLAPGWLPTLFSDAYAAYPQAILEAFGHRYPVARRGQRGRRPKPRGRCPRGLVYAQIKKHYQGNRVERVEVRPIFGKGRLAGTLKQLGFHQVNTSAVERYNGTRRQRDRRKARKTLAFSKAGRYHRWMSWLATTLQNFCRRHGGLKERRQGKVLHRSPAMAAGLTDQIWSLREWLLCPILVR
jgi:IS1 family transposase